ncbi:MAG: LLM class F420-dependent oxidoreductase [Actinomycetota bacterium]
MKFGITLGKLNPKSFVDAALAAERLGFESVWLPEHLVLPVDMRGQLVPGEDHPPVPPDTPVFDAPAYLAFLAGRTERIRLGTHVYLLGIRHPFVSARAFATLDVVSGGRAEAGVGAGWMTSEWEAAGLDPRSRGRRLDEAIDACKRLWTEAVVEHHGEFFEFPPVAFEPKPVQRPHPPVVVGGESDVALRRAARRGDGWIGMDHTPESAAEQVARLRRHIDEAGRPGDALEVTVSGSITDRRDVDRWEEAGVDRLIVAPWQRSQEAVEGMERFADLVLG